MFAIGLDAKRQRTTEQGNCFGIVLEKNVTRGDHLKRCRDRWMIAAECHLVNTQSLSLRLLRPLVITPHDQGQSKGIQMNSRNPMVSRVNRSIDRQGFA